MLENEFAKLGVVGAALAIVYISLKLLVKWLGNGKGIMSAPPKVDLTDNLKKALYRTREDTETLKDWHKPDTEGFQDWRGGRLLAAMNSSNAKLDKIIDLLSEQLNRSL